jgi:hypothetical protein
LFPSICSLLFSYAIDREKDPTGDTPAEELGAASVTERITFGGKYLR